MFEYYVYLKIKFQFQILPNINIASFWIFHTLSPQTTDGHTLNLVILDILIVVKLVVCVAPLKLISASWVAVHLNSQPSCLHSADGATVEQKDTPEPLVSRYMYILEYVCMCFSIIDWIHLLLKVHKIQYLDFLE